MLLDTLTASQRIWNSMGCFYIRNIVNRHIFMTLASRDVIMPSNTYLPCVQHQKQRIWSGQTMLSVNVLAIEKICVMKYWWYMCGCYDFIVGKNNIAYNICDFCNMHVETTILGMHACTTLLAKNGRLLNINQSTDRTVSLFYTHDILYWRTLLSYIGMHGPIVIKIRVICNQNHASETLVDCY